MKTVELFSGTKSFSKVMEAHGHETYTVDNDPALEPDVCMDMRKVPVWEFEGTDMLWASPPCEGFSVAAIGRNWTGGYRAYEAKSDSARNSIQLVDAAITIINNSKPKYWFIENPRGMLRKMSWMEDLTDERHPGNRRLTVTYCQYGDSRMKPTDIWTNAYWWTPRPMCKNGDKCHEAAPRGSRTGTQGIKGAKDRGRIPAALFEEILEQMP